MEKTNTCILLVHLFLYIESVRKKGRITLTYFPSYKYKLLFFLLSFRVLFIHLLNMKFTCATFFVFALAVTLTSAAEENNDFCIQSIVEW